MGQVRRRVRYVLVFALVFGFAVPSASARQEIGDFPQEHAWWRLTPSVVWERDTLTVEVTIVDRDEVVRVSVQNLTSPETTDPIAAPGVGDFITHFSAELYDDGTRGDRVAGDRVFTRAGVTPKRVHWAGRNGAYGTFNGVVRVQYADGTYAEGWDLFGGVVSNAYRDVFAVQDFGEGLSATAYAFFIEDAEHEVLDGYPLSSVVCGTQNFEAYKRLYSVLPDAFDFATVMPGMQILRPDGFGENVPYFVLVSNSVEGIGVPQRDNAARFGSAGRLKGAVYHSFGDPAIMDHEIAHLWGADIGRSLDLVHEDGVHWNDLADIGGQLNRFYVADDGTPGTFVYNGDETWRFVTNIDEERTGAYSPLELYVMGLIPPEEVPPIHILSNPDLSDPMRVTAESYTTITIEDITAAEGGVRSPAYGEALAEFTMAFIVTQDVAYNDAAYAYFSLVSYDLTAEERFEEGVYFAPFQFATGGRATLDTRLPVDVPTPDLAAVVTTTTTTVASPPSSVPPTVLSTTTEAVASTTTTTSAPPTDSDDASGAPVVLLVAVGVLAAATGLWFVLRKRF